MTGIPSASDGNAGSRTRRRWMAATVGAVAVAGVAMLLFGIQRDSDGTNAHAAVDATAAIDDSDLLVSTRDRDTDGFLSRLMKATRALPGVSTEGTDTDEGTAQAEDAEPAAPRRVDAVIQPGDTLARALANAGADKVSAHKAATAMGKLTDLRRLKPGQKLTILFSAEDDRLMEVRLLENVERTVIAERADSEAPGEDDAFTAREDLREFSRQLVRARGRIDDSLFLAADRAGLENEVLFELIRIFSFDVDFQREIRAGDSFELVYERFLDEDETVAKTGQVLAATLTLSGKPKTFYRFHPKGEARADYFDAKGQSVRKTLMRTPIDGARLSSGFGKRKHPILGYTRMHKGIDFAARTGTPIKAAGDGVIEVLGRNGTYGRYIRIRHNGEYKTAYAHMRGYARGLARGSRVHQGQIIGYVGTSGRSTGPHLHYEVLRNNTQINPLSVKLPTGIKLAGASLKAFQSQLADLQEQVAGLPWIDEIAQAGTPAPASTATDDASTDGASTGN